MSDLTLYKRDFHGFYRRDALAQLESDIDRIKSCIAAGFLRPNCGNGKDHIFYVICGAGKHAKDQKAVLKYAV